MSTIHNNQPAEAGNLHWLGQTVATFHRSRHWSVASPAWVNCPAARRTNWTFDVKTAGCGTVTLDNNWDKNTVFPVVNFFQNVLLQKSCFQLLLLIHLTFHKVVKRHTWGVVGSLVIVLLQMFSWFWQWNNLIIFDDVKAYKIWCNFWGHPVHALRWGRD